MAYLDYGLSLGEGFIVITGEVGAGKTTLVRNLFRQLEAHNLIAAQLVSTQLDAEDTLRSVAASFGLEHEGLTKSALPEEPGRLSGGGHSPGQACAAGGGRGAEPDAACGGRAAHAVQLPEQRTLADPDIFAGAAGVSRHACKARTCSNCASAWWPPITWAA